MDGLDRYITARASSNPRYRACLAAGEATVEIGRQLHLARERMQINAAEAAASSGWSQEDIEALESGGAVDFHLDDIFVLAQVLGLSVRISLEPIAGPESTADAR